jgi:hypothetical protein
LNENKTVTPSKQEQALQLNQILTTMPINIEKAAKLIQENKPSDSIIKISTHTLIVCNNNRLMMPRRMMKRRLLLYKYQMLEDNQRVSLTMTLG